MDIKKVLNEVTKEIEQSSSQQELQNVKVAYLGKKGKITELLKSLKDLSLEEKKSSGSKLNLLRIEVDNLIKNKFNDLKIKKSKHFVGIRPEHLKVNQNTQFTFNPEIELIENLGNEKIVYMKKDEHQLSAKIPSNVEIGNSIGFDINDIFIFDEYGNRMKS